MDRTLTYTVKQKDGYLSLARHVFNQSPRPYIRSLVKRYDIMKEVAEKIEVDLKYDHFNFRLKVGQVLKLHTDPGHYISRLGLIANQGSLKARARANATKSVAQGDRYFVVHSTNGNMKDSALEDIKKDKDTGVGHAYIKKNGDVFSLWPYNDARGYATKAEKFKKPELRGKLVNIELIYGKKESPTKAQYQTLADIYIETKALLKTWLPIAAHREIDRGLKDGHKDPTNFNFDYFYKVLKKKGVPIDSIKKQGQQRFNQLPWCEHKWQWPPVLTGLKFQKVTAKVYKAKGCK